MEDKEDLAKEDKTLDEIEAELKKEEEAIKKDKAEVVEEDEAFEGVDSAEEIPDGQESSYGF